MKQGTFTLILLIVALVIGIAFWVWFGTQPKESTFHALHEGGPLVGVLIALLIMIAAYVIERTIALGKAQGKGAISTFIKEVEQEIEAGRIDAAIEKCNDHKSSLAAVIRAGLDKYKTLVARRITDPDKRTAELQKAMEEATMMEMPLLEENLVALSTIASTSTMIGLLGTVIGMIRAFAALATGGAPDAVGLSRGISEALFNTAGGISAGIFAIIAYNVFTKRIDSFTYQIDEAAFYIVQTLAVKDERIA
ncbi:MAG: flagellar motor protein MotA [[Candidatus Thermochlorobacteriaceae] bacterium GBChlB]|jgi:biopolymer transport protein ExbB|nr:MAG: flagellar motor protein MotA [[Candidatus Thermochlorobacteriaceae] bacterium GBChlB]